MDTIVCPGTVKNAGHEQLMINQQILVMFNGQDKIIYSHSFLKLGYKFLFLGGALHLHDCSITDLWWLVKNVTYRPNCYMCQSANKSIQFHFFDKPPSNPSGM